MFAEYIPEVPKKSFYALGDILTKDDIIEIIKKRYPKEADLLICIAEKESSFNPKAIGDKGKAKGLFQIHTLEYSLSDECAFDVICSLDFTYKMIKSNKGYLWTTYRLCLK